MAAVKGSYKARPAIGVQGWGKRGKLLPLFGQKWTLLAISTEAFRQFKR